MLFIVNETKSFMKPEYSVNRVLPYTSHINGQEVTCYLEKKLFGTVMTTCKGGTRFCYI